MVSLLDFLEKECESKKQESYQICERFRQKISAVEACSGKKDCSKQAKDQALEKLDLSCAKQEKLIQSKCDKVKQNFLLENLAKEIPTLSDCQDKYGYHTSYKDCLKFFMSGDLSDYEKDFLSEVI